MNKRHWAFISLFSFFLLLAILACKSRAEGKSVSHMEGIASLEVVDHYAIRVVQDNQTASFLHDQKGKPVLDLVIRVGESFHLSDNSHISERFKLVGLKLSMVGNEVTFECETTFDARSFGGDVKKSKEIITIKPYKDKQKEMILYPEGKPMVALVVHDPWAEVIGSDSANFVLYEDGIVIFGNRDIGRRQQSPFLHARLSPAEMQNFFAKLPVEEFVKLKDHYDASPAIEDQPTYVLHIWKKGIRKTVTIYGRPGKAPRPFLIIYDFLLSYHHPQSGPWLPQKIEVMIWPFEYSNDKPILWPKGWPDIHHPSTRKRHGDSYSIYLDSSKLGEFRKFLGAFERSSQAVIMNNKKWAIGYRYPIPLENLWMRK